MSELAYPSEGQTERARAMRAVFSRKLVGFCALVVASAISETAHAVPILQLYVEGGAYDTSDETWVATSSTNTFRIWAIGDTSSQNIYGLKLSAVYDSSLTLSFSFTPGTTGGLFGYSDPSTPITPTWGQTVTDGSAPVLGDGSSLPTHSEYGLGRTWQEFALGDFTLKDSQLGDFQPTPTNPPTASGALSAQINVYAVTVTGLTAGASVHFDLYDHVFDVRGHTTVTVGENAPFSHDAGGTGDTGGHINEIPEPASFVLAAIGSLGAFVVGRRRRQQAA